MDTDTEQLRALLEVLSEFRVVEYQRGDFHLRVLPAPGQVEVVGATHPAPLPSNGTDAAEARRAAGYKALFPNGEPPRFDRAKP